MGVSMFVAVLYVLETRVSDPSCRNQQSVRFCNFPFKLQNVGVNSSEKQTVEKIIQKPRRAINFKSFSN
jgi:hypothetical protein